MAVARSISGISDLVGAGGVGKRLMHADDGTDVFRDAEVVNVREYRILGDGTNELPKILTLLGNMASGATKPRKLYFPEPQNGTHYRIEGSIALPVAMLAIEGVHRNRSVIKQFTPNTPIILSQDDLSGGNHSVEICNVGLVFDAPPTALTTQQFPIQMRPDAAGTGATKNRYLWHVHDAYVDYGYIGIGDWVSGGGSVSPWSSQYERILIKNSLVSAVKFARIGPRLTLRDIDVLNYDASIVSTGYAVDLANGSGLVIDGLNVEDWRNKLLSVTGVNGGLLQGIRAERFVFDDAVASPSVVFLTGGFFEIDLELILFYQKHTAGTPTWIKPSGATTKALVRGIAYSRSPTTPTGFSTTTRQMQMLSGTGGATIEAHAVADEDPTNGVKWFQTGADPTGQHAVATMNGKPPAYSADPTPGAAYRGRLWRIEGGAGVADALKTCEKNAADAYVVRAL